MPELMKDLVGLLNQLSLSTLIFQLTSSSGSSYISLPQELRNPRKGLINIKSNAFYGVMLGILILQKNIQKEF